MGILRTLAFVYIFVGVSHAIYRNTPTKGSQVSYLDLNACTLRSNESTHGRTMTINVGRRKPQYIRFEVPQTWKSGTYICTWNITAFDESFNQEMIVWAQSENPRERNCLGKMRIDVPKFDAYSSLRYCRYEYEDMYERYVLPNQFLLRLEMNVTEKNGLDDKDSFIIRISTTKLIITMPKRFKVAELIGSDNRIITDYNFTWFQARTFCKQLGDRRWDLCRDSDESPCRWQSPWKFSHDAANKSVQYFPLLPHNMWTMVGDKRSKCQPLQSPPSWGVAQGECPENGCDSKSYIYCCRCNKPPRVPKKRVIKWRIWVTSRRSFYGDYHYHYGRSIPESDAYYSFSHEEYDDGGEYYGRDYYWMIGDWGHSGSIDGDILQFKLSKQYTARTPITLYFCATGSNEEEYRYLVSMCPCESPWRRQFHAFAANRPRKGWKPVYFGTDRSGRGTRISYKRHCCGFDDPESSFKVYAMFEDSSKTSLTKVRCDGKKFRGPAGAFSYGYAQINESDTWPLECPYQIRVRKGYGIWLNYTVDLSGETAFDRICHRGYLEFSNPKTKHSLGRVCGFPKTGTFLSETNALDVYLIQKTKLVRFSLEYKHVPIPAKSPTKIYLDVTDRTWSRTKKVCEDEGMRLCTRQDVCPLDIIPVVGLQSTSTWVAVADHFNDWIQVGPAKILDWRSYGLDSFGDDYGEPYISDVVSCESYIALFGPPPLGLEETYAGDIAYCCSGDTDQSAPALPQLVRVNIGCNTRYCERHVFKRQSNATDLYLPHPPSMFTGAKSNVVDYFTMSSEYDSDCFNQAVYFCKQYIWTSEVELSLQPCEVVDHYFKFHLYAAKEKCGSAQIKLYVGQTATNDGFECCEHNTQNFSIFVKNAGKVNVEDWKQTFA